jgi:hypothetical protein
MTASAASSGGRHGGGRHGTRSIGRGADVDTAEVDWAEAIPVVSSGRGRHRLCRPDGDDTGCVVRTGRRRRRRGGVGGSGARDRA